MCNIFFKISLFWLLFISVGNKIFAQVTTELGWITADQDPRAYSKETIEGKIEYKLSSNKKTIAQYKEGLLINTYTIREYNERINMDGFAIEYLVKDLVGTTHLIKFYTLAPIYVIHFIYDSNEKLAQYVLSSGEGLIIDSVKKYRN